MRKQPDKKLLTVIGDHLKKEMQPTGTVTWVRKYKLITPLFGGGVNPMECDPVTLIRGSEIRGQLRFWWRATRSGGYKTVEELRQKESAIWGKAAVKGEPAPTHGEILQIQVDVLEKGIVVGPKDLPPYAAFPLQQVQNAKLPVNVVFQLTISFPEKWQADIQVALWAWETFGGIGARTRRGFGAIQLLESRGSDKGEDSAILPSNPASAEEWVRKKLHKYINEQNFPEHVPHLSPDVQLRITSAGQQASSVWRNLISKLSDFRQMRPSFKDNKGKTRKGKNKWPEANAIRELHKQGKTEQKFPRAAFGLPIIFHFIGQGEPPDYTLEGAKEGSERLTSPLILRPLACANGQVVGLAALLDGTSLPLDGLEISAKGRQAKKVKASLEAQDIKTLAIDELKDQTDVLKAFMDYLKGK